MKEKLDEIRINLLYKIYSRVPFIEWYLKSLCELEMSFFLLINPRFKNRIDTLNIVNRNTKRTDWQKTIPENTLYCSGCDYYNQSILADFFFGKQSHGFCFYLGRGDFSYIRPTRLLWDGCKECGVFEDDE